ncbi:hypothetical protein CRYUN_Cryun06bG0170100 [Craigia yunnanensis]
MNANLAVDSGCATYPTLYPAHPKEKTIIFSEFFNVFLAVSLSTRHHLTLNPMEWKISAYISEVSVTLRYRGAALYKDSPDTEIAQNEILMNAQGERSFHGCQDIMGRNISEQKLDREIHVPLDWPNYKRNNKNNTRREHDKGYATVMWLPNCSQIEFPTTR